MHKRSQLETSMVSSHLQRLGPAPVAAPSAWLREAVEVVPRPAQEAPALGATGSPPEGQEMVYWAQWGEVHMYVICLYVSIYILYIYIYMYV